MHSQPEPWCPGIPDVGLFTPDQFQKASAEEPLPGTKPSRGVVEAKPTSNDAFLTADGAQVSKYWKEYRQVLVTNFRDFLLVGADAEGKSVKLEHYRLARMSTWLAVFLLPSMVLGTLGRCREQRGRISRGPTNAPRLRLSRLFSPSCRLRFCRLRLLRCI